MLRWKSSIGGPVQRIESDGMGRLDHDSLGTLQKKIVRIVGELDAFSAKRKSWCLQTAPSCGELRSWAGRRVEPIQINLLRAFQSLGGIRLDPIGDVLLAIGNDFKSPSVLAPAEVS